MNQNHKKVQLTEEQRQQQENERYMQGRPTRLEVANYVNALLDEKYIPSIMSQIQLGMMVMQAILIEKGVCTGEDIERITKEFIEQRNKEAAAGDKAEENKK